MGCRDESAVSAWTQGRSDDGFSLSREARLEVGLRCVVVVVSC